MSFIILLMVLLYSTRQAIEEEMEKHKQNIAALLDKTSAMQARYPSAETANLAKDASVLSKKFDSVLNRGEKIGDMLQGTLEQHATDAQQHRKRWLHAAKEKIAWCGDIAGDRYSVEAKLATIVVSVFFKFSRMEITEDVLKFWSYLLCKKA